MKLKVLLLSCVLLISTRSWALPPGPTNLAAAVNGSRLLLQWTPPPGDLQSYLIRIGSAPDLADVTNVFIPAPATSYAVTIGGSAVLYVRVIAFIRFLGQTAPSNEVAFGIGTAPPPPPAPFNLTASVSGTVVTLTWNESRIDGPVRYRIQAGSQPGSSGLADVQTDTDAQSLTVAPVAFGVYYVRVRAVSQEGTSVPSNEAVVEVINNCLTPTAPTGLAAAVFPGNGGWSVVLTWNAGAGADAYRIEAGSSTGLTDLVSLDTSSRALGLVVVNVRPGTYYVRVRSVSHCGQSDASNEVLVILR